MNAIVEVETAQVAIASDDVTAIVLNRGPFFVVAGYENTVSASTVGVPSIGGTSLSAVSPDNSNGKELALAAA